MKVLLFMLCSLAMFQNGFAQQGMLTGKVTDENGLPVPLALVYLKGSSIGTSTDELGNYLLKLPVGSQLIKVEQLGYSSDSATVSIVKGQELSASFQLKTRLLELQTYTVSSNKSSSATGTRTLMEVQDIPQAIVVIGQRTIRQQGAFDLATLTRNMTGINFSGSYSGGGSYQFFNARGFDMVNSQNYRWNGQMIWNLGNNYGDNIEQVEFLKGPTSILFGDVAPGGILNFVTKKPLSYNYGAVNFKVGDWGLVRPSLDLSGPLSKDHKLRYRLNTSYEKSNSFREYVQSERYLIAPSLAWNITKKLQWNLDGVIRNSNSIDDSGLVSPDGTTAGLSTLNPKLYLGEPDRKYLFSDKSMLSTLSYQLGANWRIRNVTYFGQTKNRPWGIWPDAPDETGKFYRNEYGYHQWLKNFSSSLEIAGSFYSGNIKHNVLVGAEFQKTRFRYTNEGYLSLLDSNNINNVVNGLNPGVAPSDEIYLPFVSIIERGGFYAQDQLMFFKEKLHLLLGARMGYTKQGNDYLESELTGTNYEGYTDDLVRVGVFTPRVGLVYKPQKNISAYASYAAGYEVNSPDVFALNYLEYATPPATKSKQWELGLKSNWFKQQWGTSITIFQLQKENPYGFVYEPDSAGNISFDRYNVYYNGRHRSRGIEFDFDGKIAQVLTLTGGLAYTQTEIVKDPQYTIGNQLPNAPRYTANFWLNYDPSKNLKGLSLGVGCFYKSSFFSFFDNNPDLKVPASYTIDLAVGYAFKAYRAQLNLSNLTNQVNYLNPWTFNLFDVQPLRRAVLTLSWTFGEKGE